MNMTYEYALWVRLMGMIMNMTYECALWVRLMGMIMNMTYALWLMPYEYALWVRLMSMSMAVKENHERFNIDVNIDNFSVNIQHFKL